MAVRFDKPWIAIADGLSQLRGQMGVFQLADEAQQVIFVGYAGGLSLHGLKGEVNQAIKDYSHAKFLRYEITTSYLSRYKEILMVHKADFGELPEHSPEVKLGRLSPAGSPAS
ncbi:MAG: hypothetical protein P8N67_11735 [Pseudomonadales bacterium]|jgi:hypothetical protein|nr:hypothetical protein [Pseudomonadales bacterium]